MRRMLVLSVGMITLWFAGASLAQLSNASNGETTTCIDPAKCGTDLCDPISAETISANPISAVGHGAALNAEGQEINVTPHSILEAQRYYVKSLFHQADEKQRLKFRKKQKQLLQGKNCNQHDQVYVNSALIAWLINEVKPENAGGLATINNFLFEKFVTDFDKVSTGQDSGNARVIRSTLLLEGVKQEGMRPLMGTELNGEAYVNECRAAGVPIPPDWGSPEWVRKGLLTTNFLGGTAEVYSFERSSPLGICLALPRSEGDTITALGIICQGDNTSKACFWDNLDTTTVPKKPFPISKGESVPLTRFAGGADLLDGNGVCSDCHAGENPFIVHPNTALDQGALLKPANWHNPLVHPTWPQNPGPTNLLNGIALDSGDGSCIVCHNQSLFGRFPEVSRELRGYCTAVLMNAIRTTMPPGSPGNPSYRKHTDALLAACAKSKGELASDNSIQAGNSPAESFTPCFSSGPCPVKKTVTFMLPEAAEVFIRYDLGQSHGCCADHIVGALRILLNGTEVHSDRISYVNYGVQPISQFLEDFDYFFTPEVVKGFLRPVSQLDSMRAGPLLTNYKLIPQFSLGNLAAGSNTVELWVGDAGWNSIFEIWR